MLKPSAGRSSAPNGIDASSTFMACVRNVSTAGRPAPLRLQVVEPDFTAVGHFVQGFQFLLGESLAAAGRAFLRGALMLMGPGGREWPRIDRPDWPDWSNGFDGNDRPDRSDRPDRLDGQDRPH